MRLGLKLATAAVASLALFSGDIFKLSLAPAAAEARSWRHYGGHYGYYPRHRYWRHRGGISAGEAIAGIAIVGGIAAIASAASRDRGYRGGYDDRGHPGPAYRYDRYGYPDQRLWGSADAARDPVERCARTAEVEAQRGGGFARVADVSLSSGRRGGVEVRGVVETTWPDGDRRDAAERFVCVADDHGVREFRFVG